jgi:hypothetical protein
MKLALVVSAIVFLATIAIGVAGYLIDRSTERHADRGDRP